MKPITVSVPPSLRGLFREVPDGVALLEWDLSSPSPRDHIDLVVMDHPGNPIRRALARVSGTLIQGPFIGYESALGQVPPGWRYANAASVHEAGTAELTVGLIVAAARGLPRMLRAQQEGRWEQFKVRGLADSRVLIVGAGGVSDAVTARLEPFEVEILRVARRARRDRFGQVHAGSELAALLPGADVVVIAVPLTAETEGLVDDAFLGLMRDGAMLVNVARGKVADTGALLRHAARLQLVLDVVDPEPLPPAHPLFEAATILAPHVGGQSDAMYPRYAALIRRQWSHLLAGEEPENVVLRG